MSNPEDPNPDGLRLPARDGPPIPPGERPWHFAATRRNIVTVLVIASVVVLVLVGVGTSRAALVASLATEQKSSQNVAPAPAASRPESSAAAAEAPVAFGSDDPGDPPEVAAPGSPSSVAIGDNAVTDTTAIALLASIPIKGKSPKTGYDRVGDFGTAWLDVDRNGCDTRNDILARDLLTSVKSGACTVVSGSFVEPYTNTTVNFVRGNKTSALIQIDHLVSLSNAWQTGAGQLTQAQRISLANDPLNLLAVDGRANEQKGDGDTATWLPANKAFRCTYVARQVSVKATYGLWVTQAEHDAMANVLSRCPDARALTSAFAPAKPALVEVPAGPAPVASASAAPVPPTAVSYANCAAVRAAGAAPLHRGDPGYSSKLDRDGDGVACE